MLTRNLFLLILVCNHALVNVFAYLNRENYFENFVCDNPQIEEFLNDCKITSIKSSNELDEIFSSLATEEFAYYSCEYNCYYDYEFKSIRNDLPEYPYLTFEYSTFAKFPTGSFSKLGEIKKLSAVGVNLTELNRDDLKSFQSLQFLDLSNNKIKVLGNVLFLHLTKLREMNLSQNQIELIRENTFDECSNDLRVLNLSHNKLKSISANVLDLIGRNEYAEINFNYNEIEEIIPSKSVDIFDRNFTLLSLSKNKLKTFDYKCTEAVQLNLDSNDLENFSIGNCIVYGLNISKNYLTTVSAPNVTSLIISDNPKLSNVTFDVENIEMLEIKNIPANVITFNTLKNATNLKDFDATNTFLGTIKIDSFTKLKSLKSLKLSHTGLSHIEYGMFSHQSELKKLDISHNDLQIIDLKMLTSLRALEILDISGNNLTSLEHVFEIKEIFKKLNEIGIAENSWNCSYLASIYAFFEKKSISVLQPVEIVETTSSVMGIGCASSSQLKIKQLDGDKQNEAIISKMNEIIQELNEEKMRNSNKRYDGDIIRGELFHIQKEILELKSKGLKDVFNMLNATSSNGNTVDPAGIKNFMEQLNNLTLEKQKIANDQLQIKIDNLHIQLTKKDIEHDNYIKELLRSSHNIDPKKYDYIKSQDENGIHKTNNLLIVLITALVTFGVVFGYLKLKKSYRRQNDSVSVRARSTNTLNTTVEIPYN